MSYLDELIKQRNLIESIQSFKSMKPTTKDKGTGYISNNAIYISRRILQTIKIRHKDFYSTIGVPDESIENAILDIVDENGWDREKSNGIQSSWVEEVMDHLADSVWM